MSDAPPDYCPVDDWYTSKLDITRLFDHIQGVMPGLATDMASMVVWATIEDFFIKSTYRREHVYWQLKGNENTLDFDPYDESGQWRVCRFLEFSGLQRPKFIPPGRVIDLQVSVPAATQYGQRVYGITGYGTGPGVDPASMTPGGGGISTPGGGGVESPGGSGTPPVVPTGAYMTPGGGGVMTVGGGGVDTPGGTPPPPVPVGPPSSTVGTGGSDREGQALLALKPDNIRVELPYDVLTTYWETLVSGAMHRLFMQPGKPYTDLNASQIHGRLYRSGIASARGQAQSWNIRGGSSWHFPYYAIGGHPSGRQGL